MNTISFSKADFPDLNCKVGQEETVTVTFTPTSVGEEINGDISNVEYAEPPAEEASDEAPAPPVKSPVASIGVPMRGKTYA